MIPPGAFASRPLAGRLSCVFIFDVTNRLIFRVYRETAVEVTLHHRHQVRDPERLVELRQFCIDQLGLEVFLEATHSNS